MEGISGPDSVREDELLSALCNPDIDIVWFGRGGSGCNRIHPQVIQKARTLTPKIVIGFSDATSLLNGLAQHLGWTCFHGPVITTLGRTDPASCVVDILARLRGERGVRLDATLPTFSSKDDYWQSDRVSQQDRHIIRTTSGKECHLDARRRWAPYRIDLAQQLVDAGIFEDASHLARRF